MKQRTQQLIRVIVCIGVVVPLLITGLPAKVSADTPQTADEYFETFRSLQGTPAFQSYSEYESIRTFAVTRSQEVGSLNVNEERELNALLTVLQSFDGSYQLAQGGNYEEALSKADDVEQAIDELGGEGARTEASLAQLGLTRFYESIASQAQQEAESAQRTPEEIDLLSVAATAYERAGLPNQAAQFTAQVEKMKAEYQFATEDMETATTDTQSFLADCSNCNGVSNAIASSPIALFSQYQRVQTLRNDAQEAVAKAKTHGVLSDHQQLTQMKSQIDSAWTALAVGASFILLFYGAVVALISTVVVTQLFSWKRDLDNVEVSKVVAGGDVNV
jgi:hypothetical protein